VMGNSESKRIDETVADFKTTLQQLKPHLCEMIETNHGLLDALVTKQILVYREASDVRNLTLRTEQISQLIEQVANQINSTKHIKKFLKELDNTQHKHVSNYIRGKGKRLAGCGDDWPLCLYESVFSYVKASYTKFLEVVDAENGLLDEMKALSCINSRQKQQLDSFPSNAQRN